MTSKNSKRMYKCNNGWQANDSVGGLVKSPD
jgi:hypothetical protein